jgi:polyphenol oxidase
MQVRVSGIEERMHGVFCTRVFTEGIVGEPRPALERVRRVVPPGDIFFLTQVHGDRIVLARDAGGLPEADGIISDNLEDMLGILTADCLPVLAWSDDPPLIAAVHAGWRGLAKGIVGKAIRRMQSLGGRAIHLSLGPAIGPCCFEVGAEVADAFQGITIRYVHGKNFLDLWEIAVNQALQAGIERRAIRTLRLCTMCHSALFFSYRREGYTTGRNISLIGGKACSLPGLQAG